MPNKGPRNSTASATATETIQYEILDIVLAKVKGHPAWPARIIDPHTAPTNLQDERKIAQKNSYLVKFFQTGDYAWMNAKEMGKLEATEIKAFIDNPNKKGAELRAAYKIALDPTDWEAEQEAQIRRQLQHLEALEFDELEAGESDEAPAVAPNTKAKRKRPSEAKAPQESAKKRKSEVTRATNGSKNASATPEPTAPSATKKRGRKKDEAPAPAPGVETVREWRHKLQRIFLGKIEVTEEMMPEIDQTFTDIEGFEMKTEWLTASKLGKVLKRIGALEDSKVPLDDTYHIRSRSRELQEKWRLLLGIGEDAHRVQPNVEVSNDPAEIPALPTTPAEDAVKNLKEDSKALPKEATEPMDVDTPALPQVNDKPDTSAKSVPETSDKPSDEDQASKQNGDSTHDVVVSKSETEVLESEDKKPVTNGKVEEDEVMQEADETKKASEKEDVETEVVVAKEDVNLDIVADGEDIKETPALKTGKPEVTPDEEDDKMDCGASR
ncbi:uncharacterized protein MELLADRAFT_77589 [Melampsora larici-populina 98AG31]|uniref:PWWP domain-containing protein n=1 Tax=Melampsora larici-populina (strain 98AG31 / pathotype 3-4-7) TaxID=747676 RepID=F4RJJ8_MELLP|nr:uncharacterized protein MELLADRAFT_77589 [Melampsora larici-populina 98AG31]EGG07321.1 hypothetical protein MELLADRAFT_77589 [Melampsora larici-populina 98AG31]